MIYLSLAICALCGLTAAEPFRFLDSSLPVWFAFAPVFWLVAHAKTQKSAALHGFVFALVWAGRSFTFMWACAFEGWFPLSIYTALVYTLAFLGIRRLAQIGGGAAVFGSASVWALAEIFRSVIPLIYFPWLLLGHTLVNNAPLRQEADLLGVYGLSFVIAAFNALLAFGLPSILPKQYQAARDPGLKSAWKCACFLFAIIVGLYSYGFERIARTTKRLQSGATIGLIQGDIKTKLGRTQEMLDAQFIQHVGLHRKVIADITAKEGKPPVLVCWAETMVPGEFNDSEAGKAMTAEVARLGIPALFGSNYVEPETMQLKPEDRRIHNTAYVLDANGKEVLRYFKRRLVAFGEYIPGARDYPVLQILRSITRDHYVPGTQPSQIADIGGYHFALNICVEDIHPAIAREAAYSGADTLINLTNDGWFYGTHGPRAHAMAAMWRAIETRRPLLRVTNTGRTITVNPLGEMIIALPPETEAVGGVTLQRIDGDGSKIVTPYMVLGEFWTAVIFVLFLAASLRSRVE
ncbi:MAG: apolipoprotein N-acyltransferase [Planctomycetota bacterium]